MELLCRKLRILQCTKTSKQLFSFSFMPTLRANAEELCGLVLLVNFRSLLAPIVCRWCTEGGCFAVGSLQMTCVSAEARSCCGPLRLRPRAGKQHNCLSPVLGHRPYRRGRCVRVTRTHGHALSAARSPSSFHHTLTPRATSSITSEETH